MLPSRDANVLKDRQNLQVYLLLISIVLTVASHVRTNKLTEATLHQADLIAVSSLS